MAGEEAGALPVPRSWRGAAGLMVARSGGQVYRAAGVVKYASTRPFLLIGALLAA